MKRDKILILFSAEYPFNILGAHVDNEINYISKVFDKIYIFSNFKGSSLVFELPQNAKVFNISFSINLIQKLLSLRFIFSNIFFQELIFIRKILKLPISIKKIKIFLIEMQKAYISQKKVRERFDFTQNQEKDIYMYSFWNNYSAFVIGLLKRKYPLIKGISRAHGYDVYFERNSEKYLPGKSFLCKNLDAIFYVSEDGYNYSREKFGNYTNLKVSRLGITNNILPDFNKNRKFFHLVSCSNLIPMKRVDLIIKALNMINEKYIIKWTHIGGGPLFNSICKLANEKLFEKKNITYKILDYIPKKEVCEFLNGSNANLFINVSSTEGLPVTFMEAMSCAIPIAGTNVGGVKEILIDGINGTLLSANPTLQEISVVIEKYILMNDETYNCQCYNAYQYWLKNFNAEKNYKAFVDMILSL